MRIPRHLKSLFASSILATFTVVGFQNCSSSDLVFEDLAARRTMAEFDFNYSAKPSHYVQSLLIIDPAPNPGNSFKIRIFVGYPADSGSSGALSLRVVDENDRLLCPEESLSISTSGRDWVVSCTPPGAFSKAFLTITATGTSNDFSAKKNYTLN